MATISGHEQFVTCSNLGEPRLVAVVSGIFGVILLKRVFDTVLREFDKNPPETFEMMSNEGSYEHELVRDVLEEEKHAPHEPTQTAWFCENSKPPSRHKPYWLCGAIRDTANKIGIDWDLSKRLKPSVDHGVQTNWRTGTWQFISAARLLDLVSIRHERRDELESAPHVLLYTSTRHQASRVSEDQLGDLQDAIKTHFDSIRRIMQGETYGGKGKLAYSRIEPPFAFDKTQLENFPSTPHINLIETLRRLFIPLYLSERYLRRFPDVVQSRNVALKALKTSDQLIEIFGKHLKMDEWKEDDINDKLRGSGGVLMDIFPKHVA
ncbi:hypothetical protein HETIRDRAFT_430325 [Heterobasidion irregulare TC 32-1]|uniref:Uncharacterized protein n=1 Tax=Heterobasidion irregulare (strain TC 32-1) TaxID=747525 RepID=W4JQJ1_HETIT|nr:uncharacterized protein HETIRDRAFT_430325 [Heterobasidion irregulare TC 32-1]ETW75822.1 hypothetical protein HETIRDRAFT_430325 [Heterobasidion irregulare TC 32-1]